MKRILFIIVIICFFAACAQGNDKPSGTTDANTKVKQNEAIHDAEDLSDHSDASPKQDILEITPTYLDESTYTGEELEIVKVLNQVIKTSVVNDVEGALDLLTKDHPSKQEDIDTLNIAIFGMKSVDISLADENKAEVSLELLRIKHDESESEPSYTSRIYQMVKEEGLWKIEFISDYKCC